MSSYSTMARADLLFWAQAHAPTFTTNAAAIGLSTGQASAFSTATTAAAAALLAMNQAHDASKVATQQCLEAFNALRSSSGDTVRLIRAFARLLASGSSEGAPGTLQLVLAGQKGWLTADILAEVDRMRLGDRVVLTGFVPDSDLAALLSGAQAFLFPSLYEGFGLPILEAMACGIPVVCSNSSSLPEVAGEAALLVDPMDIDALAAAMQRVLVDEGLRQELVQRGFAQISAFSWRRCAAEALAVLEAAGRGSG